MELMTIGDFAARTRLSAKALRLYDRLGLLRPAQTDPVSGYRRYSADQVEAARLVGLLRRLGMDPATASATTWSPARTTKRSGDAPRNVASRRSKAKRTDEGSTRRIRRLRVRAPHVTRNCKPGRSRRTGRPPRRRPRTAASWPATSRPGSREQT